MRRRNQDAVSFSPSLELIARGIGDPVLRLRFLKFVAPPPPSRPRRRRLLLLAPIPLALAAIFPMAFRLRPKAATLPPPAPPVERPAAPVEHTPPGEIWKVEDAGGWETYSNGLRIDNRFVVFTHRRSYLVFPAVQAGARNPLPSGKPAGIVFHTTESRQPPLEAGRNGELRRLQNSLIDYLRRERAYHFLIDRFGRVYRIVAETDAANHAGYSVWADETSIYVNLNESFLGISFEADTRPGQAQPSISPAQIRAAAGLTDLLRGRYAIPAADCVTHAQVSVNPSNMRIGYHTDWASSFPFDSLGLPNNYARASAAIARFGFEYDPAFLHWAGTQLYAGIEEGERQLREKARRAGLPPGAYRRQLQHRYREILETVRQNTAAPEPAGG